MAEKKLILGAIAGDIIGSSYEFNNVKSTDFELFTRHTFFTDDSVLTIASMYALLHQRDYAQVYRCFGKQYPHRGYGGSFRSWLNTDKPQPYKSWGNVPAVSENRKIAGLSYFALSIPRVISFLYKELALLVRG